jgi:nucleotidyltransferase substrate binding protein (TIGR01987 family)
MDFRFAFFIFKWEDRFMATDFTVLEKALSSLESAVVSPPKNDLERDGAIQRFEYTFELTWKVAKRVLEDSGITATTPKAIIRELGAQSWIESVETWFDFLKARSASTHIYIEKTAREVFAIAQNFPKHCRALIVRLKKQ